MIKKQLLPTFIAVIVLIILAVYANYYETDDLLMPGTTAPEKLVNADFDEIRSVEFLSGESKGLKMIKEKGETARISSPKDYLADPTLSGKILSSLANLESVFLIATDTNNAYVYGFNASSTIISVVTDNETSELTIGDKMPVGNAYYMIKSGINKIYAVAGRIKDVFDVKLDDLRDKKFFEEYLDNIISLDYINKDLNATLTSLDSNNWNLNTPIKYKASSPKVLTLIDNMQNLKIVRFIEDEANDLSLYGLDKPTLKIKIKNKEGKERTLKAGFNQGDEVYICADNNTVHAASKSDVDAIRLSLNDLRDKHLDIPSITNIKEISVNDASGTINLVCNNDKWKIGEDFVDNEKVKSFIKELSEILVERYEELNELDKKGFGNYDICPFIEIKTNDTINKIYIGSKLSYTWLSNKKETILVSSSINDKFKTFINAMRNL